MLLLLASLLPFGAMSAPAFGQTASAPAKAVLYEESADRTGSTAAGTVAWRIQRAAAAPGQKPEAVVYADVEIPGKLTLHWSIQRNEDKDLQSSHLIRLQFAEPAGAAHGDVINVPVMLVKASETSAEARISGLSVKVKDNFFLIGLSTIETERKHNIELLKDRPWIDVPMMFADARRGVIMFDEGAEGKRLLSEAFAARENKK